MAKRKRPRTDHVKLEGSFRRGVANAPLWMTKGSALLAAADLLWRQLEPAIRTFSTESPVEDAMVLRLYDPFLLNAGLAIELHLKAIIVLHQPYARMDGSDHPDAPTTLPSFMGQHNLKELAVIARVPLSRKQLALLDRLSMYVTWSGRYPVPKKPAPIASKRMFLTDWQEVQALATQLRATYSGLATRWWQSNRPRLHREMRVRPGSSPRGTVARMRVGRLRGNER